MVYHGRLRTKVPARVVFEPIGMFSNRMRLHAAQGYRSPEAFEVCWGGLESGGGSWSRAPHHF